MRRERADGRVAADGGDACALARLQRELQRLLTLGGEPDAREAALAIGCDPAEVSLYRQMGRLRFVREVAREFPATRALLGGPRFDAEARAFTARTASRSYTLDGYARSFPQQLRRAARDPELGAAAELARLEREIACVRASRPRRAGGAPTRAVGRGAAPSLAPAAGARLLSFTFDVGAALAHFERGRAPGKPRRRAVRIALYRRGARVARLRIARREAPLLSALLRGRPLEHAVARGVAVGLEPAALGRALHRWVAAQLLLPATSA